MSKNNKSDKKTNKTVTKKNPVKKYSKVFKNNYTGTVDSFLEHCANLDADKIEQTAKQDLKNVEIRNVMKEHDLTHSEAVEALEEQRGEIVQGVLEELIESGYVEIVDYNEEGEPLYYVTEKGKQSRILQD